MSTSPGLRIGTRGSALALAQASLVRDHLLGVGESAELVIITTDGDTRPPDTAWGEGAFVSAIEAALHGDRIDVAVHSAKDVPTDEDPRLAIAAYLERAEPGDVIVLPNGRSLRSIDDLPVGARVGTDSPRRTAFLRARRPDLEIHPLHGNVDTRLRRLDEGQTDALMLAEAGLSRLDRGDRISLRLPPDVVPPAPGQGALAVQVRASDARTREAVGRLDHGPTRRAVELEREILAASGGGCRAPIGALATVAADGGLRVLAGFARPDGSIAETVTHAAPAAASTASVAAEVLAQLASLAAEGARRRGWPGVIVARAADQAPALALALVDRGFEPLLVPAIEIEILDGALDDAVPRFGAFEWVVVTSANAARALARALDRLGAWPADSTAARSGQARPREGAQPRIAAVGRATTRALLGAGLDVAFRPSRATARDLAEQLPLTAGDLILAPVSDAADDAATERLRARGAQVERVVAYRTIEAPAASVEALGAALAREPAAVILTSGSTARGLVGLADELDAARDTLLALPAICIGETTAAEAASAGFRVAAVSSRQAVAAIAEATASHLAPQEVAP